MLAVRAWVVVYIRHLQAVGGMIAHGDRTLKYSVEELKYEDWTKQHMYGFIRQIQREIQRAEDKLKNEADPDEIRMGKGLIEHHQGTLRNVREGL